MKKIKYFAILLLVTMGSILPVSRQTELPFLSDPDRLKFVSFQCAAPSKGFPEKFATVKIILAGRSKTFLLDDQRALISTMPDFSGETKRAYLRLIAEEMGLGAEAAMRTVFPESTARMQDWMRTFSTPATDAEVVLRGKGFAVTPEKSGTAVDLERFYNDLYGAVLCGGGLIEAKLTVTQPRVFAKDLYAEIRYRASFSTSIYGSSEGRKHNVIHALQNFDGMCVLPGETVSFNKIVGERTEERGYRMARIILDGKYQDGIGGGVCQASTTLYNALLLSGLRVTHATRHTLQPSYVPPSRDAMVNSAGVDLVFVNSTKAPVHFRVDSTESAVTVSVFGELSEEKYALESEPLEIIPRGEPNIITDDGNYSHLVRYTDELSVIAWGHDGLKSQCFLKKTAPDGIETRTLLRIDTYAPLKDEFVRGSEPRMENR